MARAARSVAACSSASCSTTTPPAPPTCSAARAQRRSRSSIRTSTSSTSTSRSPTRRASRSSRCFETHVQADHVSGLPELVERTGATAYLPAGAGVEFEHQPLADGEVVELGNTEVGRSRRPATRRPPRLPGHRPHAAATSHGSCSPATRCSSATPAARTCTPHGEHTRRGHGARRCYRSLTERLLALPDHLLAVPGALLGLGLRTRAVGQPGVDDRLRAPPQPRAAVRLRGRVRRARCVERHPAGARAAGGDRRRQPRRPAARRTPRERRGASGSGCARTPRSSRCSSRSTPSSARWSGSSARPCRSIGRDDFGLGSSAAVLSFIVAFGLAKALTNLAAGALAAARSAAGGCSIAGWALALPVPLLIAVAPELGLDRRRQRPARHQPGPRLVDDGGHEDRPRRAAASRPRARAQRGGRLRRRRARRRAERLAGRRVRRPRRARRRPARSSPSTAFVLSVLFVRDTAAHVALEQASHGARRRRRGPRRCAAPSPDATYREPALRSCSQAGLVNNLNDALAWGLVPLFLAAHGAGVGEIGLVAGALPGRVGRRPRSRPGTGRTASGASR